MNKLLSRANTKETTGVCKTVVDVVEKSSYKEDRVTSFNNKLKKEEKELTTAQNRKQKNDMTDVVDGFEKGRDNGFKSFSFNTKALTLRMDETITDNAKLIYEVIKRHGLSLYNLPNLEQTTQMDSLKGELDQSKYKAAMDAIGLTVVYDEMNLRATKYKEGVVNKNQADNDKNEEDNKKVADAKKQARATLDAMIDNLSSSLMIDDSVELKQLCNSIASIIDKANSNIHARINRRKNGHDDEADELDDELENDDI